MPFVTCWHTHVAPGRCTHQFEPESDLHHQSIDPWPVPMQMTLGSSMFKELPNVLFSGEIHQSDASAALNLKAMCGMLPSKYCQGPKS